MTHVPLATVACPINYPSGYPSSPFQKPPWPPRSEEKENWDMGQVRRILIMQKDFSVQFKNRQVNFGS
jgi:hypothetical protein